MSEQYQKAIFLGGAKKVTTQNGKTFFKYNFSFPVDHFDYDSGTVVSKHLADAIAACNGHFTGKDGVQRVNIELKLTMPTKNDPDRRGFMVDTWRTANTKWTEPNTPPPQATRPQPNPAYDQGARQPARPYQQRTQAAVHRSQAGPSRARTTPPQAQTQAPEGW